MRIIVRPLGAVVGAVALVGGGALLGRAFDGGGPARSKPAPKKRTASAPLPNSRGIIYADGFENGWELGGDARVTDTQEANALPSRSGMAMRVEAGAEETIKFLRERPLDTSSYDRLAFRIHGGKKGGQRLVLQATPSGKRRRMIRLGPVPRQQWAAVVIPLSDLSAGHRASFSAFLVKNAAEKKAAPFYVDDIRLLAPGEDLPPLPSPSAGGPARRS